MTERDDPWWGDPDHEPVATHDPGTIPIAGPWITQREVEAAARAASSSWFSGSSLESSAFEIEFAEAVGRRHAIALPSCTSGLHLALMALEVGPGDEVIVPESTWIATAAPITYVGAKPVFADVEPDTWCLSVDATRQCITEHTKAIIVVDLYGGFPDLEAIERLAAEHGIPVIEDSAEAAGGSHRGRAAGSFGVISTFSFHGSKTLTTGEGGMALCDDTSLADRMRFLRDHGRRPGDVSFRSAEIGWKYKMSEFQAAVGRVQLARLDDLVDRKRAIFREYERRLDGAPLRLNVEREHERATYWMVTSTFHASTGITADVVRNALADAHIATRPFFPPLSSLPAFAASPDVVRATANNPVSADLARRSINLPSALTLSDAEIRRVCDAILRLVGDSD